MARQTNAVEGGQWLYNEESPLERNLPPFLYSFPPYLSLSRSLSMSEREPFPSPRRRDHHHTNPGCGDPELLG